jgi:putative aldouronate transport system substrate-binding protein
MKKSVLSKICLTLVLILMVSSIAACSGQTVKTEPSGTAATDQTSQQSAPAPEKPKDVTVKFLVDWQGLSFMAPKDPVNNPVAKVLKEKTGVTLEVEYTTTPENERLNLMFASGDMPDMVMGPYWGGKDVHTQIIKKAAKEGLLMPLDELIEKVGPDLKDAFTVGVSKDFKEFDLEDPDFGGKHFILPMGTPKSPEDRTNWAYNVFVRKDILEAMKVDPSSIKNTEDLYPLLKGIKTGGFKDTVGKPVIPAGSWQNGWAYSVMLNSFSENNFTQFTKIDGKYKWSVFSPLVEKQILFMRKLVSEGLFDPEAFRQNDTVAKEKMTTGRVAVVTAHYPHMKAVLGPSLYKDHPEMEYVPVGPILDANGQRAMPEAKVLNGLAGTPAIFLTKDCKEPESVVRYLNYINSDEGMKLVYLGIEGTHYTAVDGKPRATKEFLDNKAKDPAYTFSEGVGGIYTWGVSRIPQKMFDDASGVNDVKDETYEKAKAMYPITGVDGFRISYFSDAYPDIQKITTLTDPNLQRDTIEKAYFAKNDEQAIKILNSYRDQLVKGGIEDYEKFINEKAAERNDCIN